MDSETLYRQLGRIIETAPSFVGFGPLTQEQLLWIGRVHALIGASGDMLAKVDFAVASKQLQGPTRLDASKEVMLILYKLLGAAELKAPAGARGAFIPAGSSFDAFGAVAKVFQTATTDVLVVDPYLDETILTDFATALPDNVSLRLLADQSSVKPSLKPAVAAWNNQHGSTKPVAAKLAPPRSLHDRAIFIDRKTAWILTQSLKDFAKRSPAEIVRADDTASLKIAAYEEIWNTATSH